MAERARGQRGQRGRLPRLVMPADLSPDVLDETVIHDPQGCPWLVCTDDLRYGCDGDPWSLEDLEDTDEAMPRYETQVYYTARAGIRGFPTGHGERFVERDEAMAGHRRWCFMIRHGVIVPDLPPGQPLEQPR